MATKKELKKAWDTRGLYTAESFKREYQQEFIEPEVDWNLPPLNEIERVQAIQKLEEAGRLEKNGFNIISSEQLSPNEFYIITEGKISVKYVNLSIDLEKDKQYHRFKNLIF